VLKGFLSGSFLGALVSAAAVAVLSVLSGPVIQAPQPPAESVEQPGSVPSPSEQSVAEPNEVLAPSLGDARAIDVPVADDVDGAVADTTSGTRPTTGQVSAGVEDPDVPQTAAVTVSPDVEPFLPNPQALAPSAPGVETTPSLDTAPAALPEPIEQVVVDTAPSVGVQTEAPSLPSLEDVAPEPDVVVEAPQVAPEVAPKVAEGIAPTPESVTDAQEAADETQIVQEETPPVEGTDPTVAEAETVPAPAPEPVDVETPQVPSGRLALSTETGGLKDRAVGVKVNRLGQSSEDVSEDTEAEAPSSQRGPALSQFAEERENPEDKPVISVVLIDNGSTGIGPEALQSFPYPLTFAVDAADPAHAARAAQYRRAGFEVVFIGALPEGAIASDVEVALEGFKSAVPEAVAMLELGGAGVAAGPQIIAQKVSNLKESGHGLLTVASGLNSANRVADRANLPNKVVFRDLDGDGQDPTIIRRFLDQAAFKAAQSDGLVLLGRLQPNTVSALILWGGLDRAKRVALAPVSAVLAPKAP